MKVLVQKNIWNEYGYDRFLASLRNAGVEVKEVNIIPFTTEIVDLDDFAPDYVFGSTRFITICREKGMPVFPKPPWSCTFQGQHYINREGVVMTLAQLRENGCKLWSPAFAKPFDTEKFFTGTVLESPEDVDKLQLSTSFVEDPEKERIFVGPYYKIDEEVRFFVIGGKVITGSRYKVKGNRIYSEVDPQHPAWIQADHLLQTSSNHTALSTGFVLDLGLVDGEWKIIELNDMGSAGLYMCDTDILTRALIANCDLQHRTRPAV